MIKINNKKIRNRYTVHQSVERFTGCWQCFDYSLRNHCNDSLNHYCATLFRVLRTASGRWDAEEGHGDPSQACICLMLVDSTV
jgi:hypothetical protein